MASDIEYLILLSSNELGKITDWKIVYFSLVLKAYILAYLILNILKNIT